MDQIESIIAAYHRIKIELDIINKAIEDSDFASDSDLKPAAHNFFTNMAIMVGQAQGILARCESDVIEAEYIIDPDFQEYNQPSVTKIIRRQW